MASKARFGRLPRAAPSLTSTIVALAQEYQRVRESNIVDAWKNGGEFEGKPVHDDQILKWFKARRDEISPGDPKWDYYDNQVTQYEFAIANSKMELSYKQKKTSDAGMVAFYHKWASKLPPDSEAYREREKLAAAYADRAASGRAASGRAASDKAYAASMNKDFRKEFAYDQTEVFLESEAHNRGILQKGETLGNVDPNTADGHAINALWDEIATSPEYADQRAFYTAAIKKNGDPNFNGDFSQDAFNAMGRIKKAAITDRIQTAKDAGRKQDVKNFRAERDQQRGLSVLTGGFDEMALYEDSRKEWEDTFTDPNATPLEVDRANQKYIADLTKVKDGLRAQLKPGEVDDRLGAVDNEIKTMNGDEHPYQHWMGMFGPLGNEGGASATDTAKGVNQTKADITNLGLRDANGDPLFFLSKVDNGNPVATTDQNHKSAMWGVISRSSVDPNAVYVVQADDGDPRAGKVVTVVQPTPIMIAGDTANDKGDISITQSKNPGAYHYTMPDGTVGYKYQDASGKWLYTPDNPFGANTPKLDSKGGSVYVPTKVPGGPPQASAAILPAFYDPNQNVAMTSRIAKSGYGMWLISSDPKHSQAYAAKPEDIIASLKLEAGGDPARFQEMVIDADQRRAVYLGNSTDEQNRLRQNYYNGTPNPVPLTTAAGINAPSAEGRAIAELTAAPGSQADMENRRGRMGDALSGKPSPSVADALTLDEEMRGRRNRLSPNPPQAGPIPTTAPTSLGAFIPGNIAGSLVGIIQQVTGNGPTGLPTGVRTPAMTGPSLVGPVAPQPTAPKPVAPKPAPPPTPHPATAGLVAPTQATVTYPTTSPRDTHGPGHGALEY